jgi:hypothetical protein
LLLVYNELRKLAAARMAAEVRRTSDLQARNS